MPVISILTPVYNGIEYLEECVQSVKAQTFTDWELLIAINGHGEDGGSVYQQAAHYASDPRIRVLVQPTVKGKVASLNNVMAHATGEWICVLDCDDIWAPNKLEVQIHVANSLKDAAVIGTWCSYIGNLTGAPKLKSGWIELQDLLKCNEIINSSCMIHRTWCHWREVFGMDDYDMWLRIALIGGKLYNIPQSLVYHRVHEESAFNSKHVSPTSLRDCYTSVHMIFNAMYSELQ